ncbi:uncharacterized protein LOC112171277 [Rosa chinensis]|uniref:uncharacterized protein LOC112171277 n=1 Tax=Rosa chinensis TaxID=74649 RepID=UPI000D0931BC|nr:uncharacterized protein LOC112171277 [Rosa chinensis]
MRVSFGDVRVDFLTGDCNFLVLVTVAFIADLSGSEAQRAESLKYPSAHTLSESLLNNMTCGSKVRQFRKRGRVEVDYKEDGTESRIDDSADEDYRPHFEDDEYGDYGWDDDWLEDMEGEFDVFGESIGPSTQVKAAVGSTVEEEFVVEDNEDMYIAVDSDEEVLGGAANSDGEIGDDFLEFNPKSDMNDPQFKLGMKFASAKILRAALREKAIMGGWECCFLKSDKKRVRVICKADNCPFELYASKMQHESTLMVKTYHANHTCSRVHVNSMVKAPYLTEKFVDQIKLNPDWKTESLAQTMSAGVKAKVFVQQAYRAKRAALKLLERSIMEQYARVRDYGSELKRVNPETTVDIKCDFNDASGLPVFKRMYIYLGALKTGFKAGCRSVIGLEGCHLKSPHGGQLVTAVGVDANNTTWVVAYAQVEMESTDSWKWFLQLLVKDLDIEHEGAGWTFISDKQKGLLPTFESIIPLADHRFCVRHLWTNFTKLFPGKAMKDQLWAIAKSTTLAYFHKEMVLIKQMDPNAYDWLTDPIRPPLHWCRTHFKSHTKCDILLNNLCESFNAFILGARGKPVVSSFEEMRVKLMKRIMLRKEKMMKYEGTICPKP